MTNIIDQNIDKIKALCAMYNVEKLFVFGSATNETFNEKSDIDLLIHFKPMEYGKKADHYFELADKFEELFKRPVDLITAKSLKNPYFIQSVNQTIRQIYGQ